MTETPSIVVAGDGQMGLVMAAIAAEATGGRVTVWGPFPAHLAELRASGFSERLPGWKIPESIELADDASVFASARFAVNAIPTQFIRQTWGKIGSHLRDDALIVSTAKGLETGSGKRPSEILAESIGRPGIEEATISGPTIATELARRMPAVMLAASPDPAQARRVREVFTTAWLRIYESDDLLGVELAGALKNVIALAAGMCDGLELGFNAKSALLARGLAEMSRYGAAAGARQETFFGVAGVGDLATTCFSPDGRNRSCGEAIGRGASLQEYIDSSMCVVEGVPTVQSVMEGAAHMDIEMPITAAIASILFDGVSPRDAIAGLMQRPAGGEGLG
ncbi:MAG: NAD(P)-dependent glycerol-3-phosphate dehydrogenase [Phycisphaerales bacterium]|nr:NAD(P)-dependent glycerol-3-phosphate dehydrogenase [Phycisphaerales bacterium]